jgi:hypothetical protein
MLQLNLSQYVTNVSIISFATFILLYLLRYIKFCFFYGGNRTVKEKMGEGLYLKGVVLAAIFLFIGASVVLSVMGDNSTFGNTIYVDDDAEPSWYDSTHVKTIQAGIDNVSIGDTVYVYSGTYYENVVVDKTINLVGENRDSTVIDGTGFGDVVQLTAHEVSISEFTIQNSGNFKLGECNAGLEVCSCFIYH